MAHALYTPEVLAAVERAQAAAKPVGWGQGSGDEHRYEDDPQALNDPCDPSVTGPEFYQSHGAEDLLREAQRIVAGSRAVEHGPKERNHKNIAVLWEAYMQLKERNGESARFISAYDVATMMELLKIARRFAGAGRTNRDNYVDSAGYAGLAGEIALNGKEMRYGPSS